MGVEIKTGQFFKNMRRFGLWQDAEAVHRSNVTRARQKISWKVFQDILRDSVNLAYDIFPDKKYYLWSGRSVYAIDGSHYILPATPEIREKFDPKSGLEIKGRGHFPQCLVSTLYDVFRQFPVARTVVEINGSERKEAAELLKSIPTENNLILFDRGYPSFELIHDLTNKSGMNFLFRCPATSSFKAVSEFVKSKKQEDYIWINPNDKFLSKVASKKSGNIKPIKLRVIRLVSPSDGTVSVLLTDLYNQKKHSIEEISSLYFKRWEVEVYYRDEKTVLDSTKFHARTANGILQELYAVATMRVIAAMMIHLSSDNGA